MATNKGAFTMYSLENNKQERTHQKVGFLNHYTVPHRILDSRLHRGHGGGRNCTNWCNTTKTKRSQVSSTTDLWPSELGPTKGCRRRDGCPPGPPARVQPLSSQRSRWRRIAPRLLLSSLFPLGIPELRPYMRIRTILPLLLCRIARKKNA